MVITLLSLFCTLGAAQETESRIQKIMHPDRNEASSFGGKTFYGGSVFQSGAGSAHVKSFHYTENSSLSKSFDTKSFSGATPYSTGKFATHGANTKSPYELQGSDKKVDTKTSATKEAAYTGKNYTSTSSYYGTREFRGRGKSQDSLDLQKKDTPAMSIDEVRAVLNKNK